MKLHISFVTCAMLLAGCATPYQKTGITGGFSETRLQQNMFAVDFAGNGYTRKDRASDFALLRCAELTLQHGFKYFAILDSSADSTSMYYNTGQTHHTYGTVNTFGNTSYGSFNTYSSGGATIPIVKPSRSYTIMCYEEKPDNVIALDAHYLADSICAKYGLLFASDTVVYPKRDDTSKPKRQVRGPGR